MNRITNGRSTSVTSVAEVKNSRSDSNSRNCWAKAPAEGGRASSRMPSTCWNTLLAMITSALRPAVSMK
ncbi:hypothetical protein D3C83_116360 [compost metagenome]